jgi:hypothetical protein
VALPGPAYQGTAERQQLTFLHRSQTAKPGVDADPAKAAEAKVDL